MIKCVRVLCVKFGHACVHGIWLCACVCSISQPFSWPPYAELGAQAGSICRVNAQPQPRAAVPYKPHYSSRNHAKKITTATRTPSGRTKTFAVRDRHNWWSQGLSHNDKVARACLGRCFWNSFWLSEQVSDEHCRQEFIILNGQACNWTSYPLVKWSGEELHFLSFISLE